MILITRSGSAGEVNLYCLIVTGSLITPSSDGCKVNKFAPFQVLLLLFPLHRVQEQFLFQQRFRLFPGSTKFSAIVWCNKRVLRFNFLVDFVASNCC